MGDILRDEYPFRFIDGPLSLATLASTELSLHLWREKTSTRGTTAIASFLEQPFSCTEFFPVPSRIKTIIDEKIISMGEHLQKWVKFYSKFGFDLRSVFSSNFDDVVCDPNGTISYTKTAIKTLHRTDIDAKMKFRIACTFCLKEDVERIWPSVSSDFKFMKAIMIERSMPAYFWGCLMTSSRDFVSIENLLMTAFRRRNWAAMKYFWHRLSDQLKVPKVLELFKNNDIDVMISLLPLLNESQAQIVFEAKACEILSILLSNHEYVDHVLTLWTYMQNVISPDVFLQLIRGLWKLTWNIDRANNMRRYNVDGLLMEIWTKAPDLLKSYVLYHHSAEFFDNLKHYSPGFVYNYGHDMEFLLELMKNNSFEFRKSVWERNWRKIVLRSKPSYLPRFLEMCYTDSEELGFFKLLKMAEFRLFYTLLIRQGFYSDLNDYLELVALCSKMAKVRAQEILKSNISTVIVGLIDEKKFQNFDTYVSSLFTDAVDLNKFKAKFALLSNGLKSLFCLANQNHLKACKRIVNFLLTSKEDKDKLKFKFLEFVRQYLITRQDKDFNVSNFDELMKWLCEDESEIAAFKKSLNIDEMFANHLNMYAFVSWDTRSPKFVSGKEFFFFQNFAKWYFVDDQAIRNFKLEKIDNYMEIPSLRHYIMTGESYMIERMLNWFFDNDSEEVAEFQERLIDDRFNLN